MKKRISIGVVVTIQLCATIAAQLVVIRLVGVGYDTDAYIAAQTVPAVFSAIIITALQSVWLPRLSVLNEDTLTWRVEQATAQGQALLLGAGVIFFLYLSLPVWTSLIFPGFVTSQLQKVILLSGPLLLAAVFNIQTSLLTVALRASNRFVIAEFIAMIASILSLISIILFLPKYGLEAVVLIALVRAIIVYIIQMHMTNWSFPSINKGMKSVDTWMMIKPLLLGTSVYKMSPFVDRYWLSQLSNGGITVVSLAQTVMGALATILERLISMPLIPSFSRYIKKYKYKELKRAYKQSIYQVTFITIFIAILLVLFKPVIVVLLMDLLNLTDAVSQQIWLVCLLLLGYLHVAVSGTIVVAVFYAFGDSKTPVMISMFGFAGSLLLKAMGFNMFSLYGLVLATSVYYIGNIIAMHYMLEKKINVQIS